ncbi:ferri-bacillibactin esterase [Staphylotrichum tortipilum]|uniref:Ferri-bacillibactin esterase n=1 Tax=Staphylotrichum tortipilum TaxID=2831512 RepID=A0AAN6RS90_9PEZI|nr:ferri-bacillibactin esterase [Staphylotrichum longicolle]
MSRKETPRKFRGAARFFLGSAATPGQGKAFTPLPPFPATVFPNIALWNATRGVSNTDVVVSIGYPLTDAVYDMLNQFIDYNTPFPESQGPPLDADAFLDFIDHALRPWLHSVVFSKVDFTRDAMFGHSFGGLLTTYALISRPHMFDAYFAASTTLELQNNAVLDDVLVRLGAGDLTSTAYCTSTGCNAPSTLPALIIAHGSTEHFPAHRRAENEIAFQTRENYSRILGMTGYCHDLFDHVKASGRVRDVILKEYAGQDHAAVAASAIMDGIDYFLDWQMGRGAREKGVGINGRTI